MAHVLMYPRPMFSDDKFQLVFPCQPHGRNRTYAYKIGMENRGLKLFPNLFKVMPSEQVAMPGVDMDPLIPPRFYVYMVDLDTRTVFFDFSILFIPIFRIQKVHRQYFYSNALAMDGTCMFQNKRTKLPIVFIWEPVGDEKDRSGQRVSDK